MTVLIIRTTVTDIVNFRERNCPKDALILTVLSYNVGHGTLLGYGKHPKSRLLKKLEAGDRDIYKEYISYCHYKGKYHAMLLKRRKIEFTLLYIP